MSGPSPRVAAALAKMSAEGTGGKNGAGRPRLPAFPVDLLPESLAHFASAVAEETQTPVDLACGLILSVCSAAVLGVRVRIRPGWVEELALYVLIALPTAERKSTVLRQIVAPLRAIESERLAAILPQIRHVKAQRDVFTAQRDKAKRAKGQDQLNAVLALDEQLDALPKLVEPVMLTDDVTPEVLATLLNEQGGVAIITDEAAVLDNLAGRYSNGKANLQIALKAYSGDDARVHRRDRTEHITRPLLAIGIVTQPAILEEIVANDRMREQGLLGRMILLQPATALGHRKIRADPVYPPDRETYDAVVRGLWRVPKDSVLEFSPEGRAVFEAWALGVEPRLEPDIGDLAAVGDWAGRLPGRVARISALIHLSEHRHGEEISRWAVERAITISEYLLAHARSVLDQRERDRIGKVLAWAKQPEQGGQFTVRDVHTLVANRRGPVAKIRMLIERMVEFGYVEPLPAPDDRERGRPGSPIYQVIGWTPEAEPASSEDPLNGNGEASPAVNPPAPGGERGEVECPF